MRSRAHVLRCTALTEKHASHAAVRQFTELVLTSYPTLVVPGSVRTAASRATARPEGSASAPGTRRQSPTTRQRSA